MFIFFTGGSGGKDSVCNAGNLGLITGLGRSPVEGNGNPFQYSCLENSMDRGFWRATVVKVGTSLVLQWILIICQQGTWPLSVIWEDATCDEATKPLHHSYWHSRACVNGKRSHYSEKSACTVKQRADPAHYH